MSGGEKVNMAGKYEYWLSQEGQVLLQGWARDCLNEQENVKKKCIFPSTLYRWEKKKSGIFEGLKKGKKKNEFLI